jgi:hypothetical protein
MFNRNSILLLVAAAAGCGTNPCDVELLLVNMTPEQQANCAECSNANDCPDETGETGEDPSDVVTCTAQDILCLDGDARAQLGANAYLYDVKSKAECNGIVGPVPCDRSWFDPEANTRECVSCDLPGLDVDLPNAGPDTWPICWNGVFKWDPAFWVSDSFFIAPDWPAQLLCESDMLGIPQVMPEPMFTCPNGMMGIAREQSPGVMDNIWTCRCPDGDDAACQPNAVCEAGWVFDGLHPTPTLCVWGDGADANGAAPDGAAVYGLERWSDGIVCDGDVITIDPTLLVDLWPHEGQPFPLFNDDQRIDERGTITHCGAESLCEHLGLAVGERIVLDGLDVETLVNGGVVLLEVERPRVGSRWLTITVDGV